jgi:hypothetical protein
VIKSLLRSRVLLGASLVLGLGLYFPELTMQVVLRWNASTFYARRAIAELATHRDWIDTPAASGVAEAADPPHVLVIKPPKSTPKARGR